MYMYIIPVAMYSVPRRQKCQALMRTSHFLAWQGTIKIQLHFFFPLRLLTLIDLNHIWCNYS